MPPRKSPKRTPKTTPTKSPHKQSKKSSGAKSADDVLALVREEIDRAGAVEIASLASDDASSLVTDWISTQSIELDSKIGTPGIPCGRITEVFGKNHSGKSTLSAHLAAECQRRGGVVFFLDQESAIDKAYYARIGVDVERMQMIQPKRPTIEGGVEALEAVMDQLAKYPDMLALLVWDTIAAAPADKELEGEFGKVQPGHAAKAIRSMCRRMLGRLSGSKIALLILNQTYSKIGVVYGNPEVAYGGDGLAFYASLRLHTAKSGKLPDDAPGTLAKVKVIKSKVSDATGREAMIAMVGGNGFDNVYSIYMRLGEAKLISHGGGGHKIVRLSETEELRWVGGWQGLVKLCASDRKVYDRLLDAYRALDEAARSVPVEVTE